MKKKHILILNGPNLNLTGIREPEMYGNLTFEVFIDQVRISLPEFEIKYFQSNVEGELINKLHETGFSFDGIILNAGGYTHTSVALADAVGSISSPVVEVHMSNILAREHFRHQSLIAPKCAGSIMGFGMKSYELALEYFKTI